MTDRKLIQQALNALEYAADATKPEGLHGCECLICKAIPALRDRLAQPEQEPVAWMYVNLDGECEQIEYAAPPDDPSITPLYTAPPQRPWVGLTDEEIMDCTHHMTKDENETWVVTDSGLFEFAHILEEWLKGKNK